MGNEVILELSIRCSDLDYYDSLTGPSTMVCVYSVQPQGGFWVQLGETEVVHGSVQPQFKKIIKFYASDKIDLSTKLRFVVFNVKNQRSSCVTEIGVCFCFIEDLLQAQRLFTFHLLDNGEFAGCLYVFVLRKKMQLSSKRTKLGKRIAPLDDMLAFNSRPVESIRQYGNLSSDPLLCAIYPLDSITSRSYRFPTKNGKYVKVEELMLESRISFHIPILYLKLCINNLEGKVLAAENLGELSGYWNLVRKKKIVDIQKHLDKYRVRLQYLKQRYGPPFFKRSVDRLIENLDFVPVNLHLQRLRVKDQTVDDVDVFVKGSSSVTSLKCDTTLNQEHFLDYDVLTVGATAQHSMAFKQGGLLALLTNANEGGKSKNSLPLDLYESCLKHVQSEEDQLHVRIDQLKEQIRYQLEKLRIIIKKSSTSSHLYSDKLVSCTETLACLSQKVCELATCCESGLIARSAISLASSRSSYKAPHEVEMSYTYADVDMSKLGGCVTAAVDVDASPEVAWEEQTYKVKTTLSEVVKSVHEYAAFVNDSECKSKANQAEIDLNSLYNLIEKLHSEASAALTFSSMFLSKFAVDHTLEYRRNSVFSQALSISVCGVATAIVSSLHNPLKLQQYSEAGMFIQAECLVSTHGNEQGMLQDYAIGIMDLENVFFKCVCASSHLPSDMTPSRKKDVFSNYLPTLEKKNKSLIVLLPIEDNSFHLLPTELQNGKLIKLHPSIYNIGVNEEQSFAERFGNTALQDYLNVEALKRTLKYYDLVRDRCPLSIGDSSKNPHPVISETSSQQTSSKTSSPENISLIDQLKNLDIAVHSKKSKNIEILELASDVCRRLNGVRITSCKSAKDRTSMSVTLEQTRILVANHDMSPSVFNEALNCMRSEGTRRENTLKNTGYRRYAFTAVQLMTFPKIFRPPDGTYGKGES